MPLLPTAPVRIQPYFGYRNQTCLRLTARALRSRVDSFAPRSKWQAARTMLAQFASHEVAGLPVTLERLGPDGAPQHHQAVTDDEGYAHFAIAIDPAAPYPDHPMWETVGLQWLSGGTIHRIDAQVLVPGRDTGLGVISDIDDTVIETGITGNARALLRNWRRVLMQMPHERELVPGADLLYTALGGGEIPPGEAGHAGARQPATKRPFFYVSSSPWNLFSYLVAYMRMRGLPLGPIMLRDWGLNRATFGSASHGAHKRAAIDTLLGTYPELKFALIGDDSQGDLTAFAEVALAHPGRVRAIFIRKTGEPHDPAELAAIASLKAAHVPLWLGDSYTTGHAFLASIGLLTDDEARAVVDDSAAAPAAEAAT